MIMKYLLIFITLFGLLFLTRNVNAQTPPVDQYPELHSYQVLENNPRCFKHAMTEQVGRDYYLGEKVNIICK